LGRPPPPDSDETRSTGLARRVNQSMLPTIHVCTTEGHSVLDVMVLFARAFLCSCVGFVSLRSVIRYPIPSPFLPLFLLLSTRVPFFYHRMRQVPTSGNVYGHGTFRELASVEVGVGDDLDCGVDAGCSIVCPCALCFSCGVGVGDIHI